jgi:hypothetical protein
VIGLYNFLSDRPVQFPEIGLSNFLMIGLSNFLMIGLSNFLNDRPVQFPVNQLSSLFPGGDNISGYSSSLNQSSLAVAAIATFKM